MKTQKRLSLSLSLLIPCGLLLIGCQPSYTSYEAEESSYDYQDDLSSELPPDVTDTSGKIPTPTPTPSTPGTGTEQLSICSPLNYSGVTWSKGLTLADKEAFLVALNISGSFEGSAGWANLTNNFDGMGISMGLLNQTLGTGSLQPLLFNFRKNFPRSYASVLSSSQKNAMDKMLDAWGKAKGLSAMSFADPSEDSVTEYEKEWAPTVDDINPLDIDKFYGIIPPVGVYNSATADSVKWALNTVFTNTTGKTFKPEWRTALKNLLAHPDYISIQIQAAEVLHKRALSYQKSLGFYQLRGYLFLFDIAVQNGTLQQKHFDEFWAWYKNNRTASTETQMLKMIDIRAASSLAQWRADVKSRKRTIVLSKGYVHGANRDLPKEYCYKPTVTYPGTTISISSYQ